MPGKQRYVDLKLSGRKLNAPPEGYTPRQEAAIKRWLSTEVVKSAGEDQENTAIHAQPQV